MAAIWRSEGRGPDLTGLGSMATNVDIQAEGLAPFADLSGLEATLREMALRPSDEFGMTELEHGAQCAAALALARPEDLELRIAGLVYDIRQGPFHEEIGADAVRGVLDERVAALVGLHVDAKRYLVATDRGYRGLLSDVSLSTLRAQGEDMSEAEIVRSKADPHASDALVLRRADDAAKVICKSIACLDVGLPVLREVA